MPRKHTDYPDESGLVCPMCKGPIKFPSKTVKQGKYGHTYTLWEKYKYHFPTNWTVVEVNKVEQKHFSNTATEPIIIMDEDEPAAGE